MSKKSILLSGYARLPAGTVSYEVYGVMALVVLVDFADGTIVEVDCTLSTKLAERFVAKMLIGKSLRHSPQEIINLIKELYQGAAQKSIIFAFREITSKYMDLMKTPSSLEDR